MACGIRFKPHPVLCAVTLITRHLLQVVVASYFDKHKTAAAKTTRGIQLLNHKQNMHTKYEWSNTQTHTQAFLPILSINTNIMPSLFLYSSITAGVLECLWNIRMSHWFIIIKDLTKMRSLITARLISTVHKQK